MAEVPAGIILVSHEVLGSISQEEMLAALPKSYLQLPRHHISLISVKTELATLGSFDWFTAGQNQAAEYLEKVRPIVNANPGWRIQYFGLAPIPLAMALGYQIGGIRNVDVYQKLHTAQGGWQWRTEESTLSTNLATLRLPQERLKTQGDLVVRVSLSHAIQGDETASVVPEPIGEIDLKLEKPDEDALKSAADLELVANQFSQILDWAREFRPGSQINVFLAATIGVAFRFGTCVSPTIHNPVHVYQYFSADIPRYRRAFVLQQPGIPIAILTAEDTKAMAVLRQQALQELKTLQNGSAALALRRPSTSWLSNLFPELDTRHFGETMAALEKIEETSIPLDIVDVSTSRVTDGYRYDSESRSWALDDTLLFAISRKIADATERRLALRLFFLHETIHRGKQRLTGGRQIRRFPKIVEELDYQADTWAFLHEAVIWGIEKGPGSDKPRDYLLRVIKAAISTFWAFDAYSDPSRMEIRRINRYLVWYWQRLEIERLQDEDWQGILKILANRPIVEIAGAAVRAVDDRVFFLLDEVSNAEIGVVPSGRLFRFGHGHGSQVRDIFKGFRDRDDQKIVDALKTIFDQVVDLA